MNVLKTACVVAQKGGKLTACLVDGRTFTGEFQHFEDGYAELINVSYTAPHLDLAVRPTADRVFINPEHVTAAWAHKKEG